MKLLPMTDELLPAAAALEQAAFVHPWSEQALALLCGDTAFGIACCEGEELVAYGGMVTVLDEGQITNIATHPDHRRHGYAAAVLSALLAKALERGIAFVTLEVRESNLPAIALYEKLGFVRVGHRPRFYTHPVEGALIMRCDLTEN